MLKITFDIKGKITTFVRHSCLSLYYFWFTENLIFNSSIAYCAEMAGVMCKFQIDFHLIWSYKAIHKVSFMDWFLTHLSKTDNKKSSRVVIFIEDVTSWTKSYLCVTENVKEHNSKHKIPNSRPDNDIKCY